MSWSPYRRRTSREGVTVVPLASAGALSERTFIPDESTQAEIIDFADELRKRQREVAESMPGLVDSTGKKISLPEPLFRALVQAADALAAGFAVTVAPQQPVLSTYQAAEYLGVSRPTLIKLLEEGVIPYEKSSDRPGAHRRVPLGALVSYREERSSKRKDALDELVSDAAARGEYADWAE